MTARGAEHSRVVTEGLAALRANGARLGPPVRQSVQARKLIAGYRRQGLSMKETARRLTDMGVETVLGGRWWPSTIRSVEQAERKDLLAQRIRLSIPCHLEEERIMFGAEPPVHVGTVLLQDGKCHVQLQPKGEETLGCVLEGMPALETPEAVLAWVEGERRVEAVLVESRLC